MKRIGLSVVAILGAVAAPGAGFAQGNVVQLPDVDITTDAPAATRPAPVAAPVAQSAPSESVLDSTPANNTRINAAAITRTASPYIADTLARVAPSVDIQSSSGNPLQPDVQFRGFQASPIEGAPQGLAVYQNGVRINEAFGDTVNWDQIPTIAVLSMDLISNNPAFGLNALGGAVNMRMKDGFTYQGGKLDVMGGSYGRIQGALDYGQQIGPWAFYGALEGVHDGGFRQSSPTNLGRFYSDLGYRNEKAELHLNVGLSSNFVGASGPAPIQLLQQDWSSVYTTPQSNTRDMGMVNLSGRFELTPTWTLNGNAYVRRYVEHIVDGNPSNAQPCTDPTLLCYNDPSSPAFNVNGAQIATSQINNPNGYPLGEIDRSSIATTSEGATLQLSNNDKLFGYQNHFSVGSSFDFGQSNYAGSAELGITQPNYVVSGSGVFLGPSGSPTVIGPVNLHTINRYAGVYALDAFDFSDRLTLSGGARLNYASLSLNDQLGGALSGEHDFTRINPLIGLTYKITPELQVYGSYAEANRAPTPLELGCADPLRPCLIGSFLVADPSLKQVVSRTYEAGLRGQHTLSQDWGSIGWKLGAFETRNANDILNIQDPTNPGFGYFQNIGDTRREGVEASVDYRKGPFSLHASYAYIDATFQSNVNIGSNSPAAVNGIDTAAPGNELPMVPRHRVKLSTDYEINSKAKIGADFLFTGPQRFVGDASNTQPQLPAYWTVSLNGSYKVTDSLEVYGRIDNLFDRRYYLYGTYFDTTQLYGNLTDARSVAPAQPISVYGGVRLTF